MRQDTQPSLGQASATASVVCLHASASSSRQWRPLQRQLAASHQMLVPDLYGSGDSPQWTGDRALTLADEVALLEPVLQAAGRPFCLVGHSYGGAVALRAALSDPGRIQSLVLIEPVMFSLLVADDPDQPAAREIIAVRDGADAAVARGALDRAAERFIDYWMGLGTLAAMPPARRAAAAEAMRDVRHEWSALFAETTPLAAYAALDMPTLFLAGSQSPASARRVTALLAATLPRATVTELDGAGHMSPVTHPGLVNAAVQAHLARHR
ncbi:MAG: alpha/beta hydrolase [Actinomycetota bacterium]